MKLISSDPDIASLIQKEAKRQRNVLEMIPSENYASRAVREAVGSVLMNKYAEGQTEARYYQGNSVIDEVETLCKTRALFLFGLDETEWGVNVQALSGSPANLAVLNAALPLGETIMAMYLPDGGHLSHGWHIGNKRITMASKIWNICFYYVDKETRVFDYDAILTQAIHDKPKLIISGGTAYPREIDHKHMGEIASKVGAYYLADIAHEAGLVAAGVNTSPFPYADFVTMTTHKTLRGPRGAMIFTRRKPINRKANIDDMSTRIDRSVFPAIQGGPHEHTIAGIAVALGEAKTTEFKKYSRQIIANAKLLAGLFLKNGYDVVSGGTDKHLVLVDLRNGRISATIAAQALEYAHIVINKNTVPNDTGTSVYPSGIRFGTPAVTTRGMKEKEMKQIAGWMFEVLHLASRYRLPDDTKERKLFIKKLYPTLRNIKRIKQITYEVTSLCGKFPVP